MDRLQRWDARTEWPLGAAALAFLAAYAWPILQRDLDPGLRDVCRFVNAATWAIFVLDYVVRLVLATERGRYFAHHIPDLLAVALPLLRPLRLLRIVTMLRLMNRNATASLRGRVAVYVVSATALVVFCAALAVLNAERDKQGSNIENFGDALWWAGTTVSTVGYGDRFPVTAEGRFVAVALMLAGIALLGIITASLATWLIEKVREVEESADAATRRDLAEIREELRLLRAQLAVSETGVSAAAPTGSTAPG
jgi:voltage-gated potassium channel